MRKEKLNITTSQYSINLNDKIFNPSMGNAVFMHDFENIQTGRMIFTG